MTKQDKKNNLSIWNRNDKTDPQYIKNVSIGARKFQSVDPYARIRAATKEFGSFGDGWGVEDPIYDCTTIEKTCIYTATLFYRNEDDQKCSFPIGASIETHMKKQIWEKSKPTGKYESVLDSDFFKKVTTDALTKGLSMLGFSADVYLGLFEDEKYVAQMKLLASIISDERMAEIFNLADSCKNMDEVGIQFKLLSGNEQINADVLEIFGDMRLKFEKK